MSTIAANPEVRPHTFGVTASLERRGVRVFVGVSALVIAVGGGLLLGTSDHLAHPVAYGLEVAALVALSAAAALYWVVHRPGNRIALILLAYAAVTSVISLEGSANPLLFSLGVLFEMPAFLLSYYLILSFPEGRLVGTLERVLFVALAWTGLASFLPWFFFSPTVSGGSPQAACTSCPSNPLMIANRPGVASGFGTSEFYFAMLVETAIAAGLLYRLARSSRPRRRSLLPVYVPALLLTIPLAIFRADSVGLVRLGSQAFNTLGWVVSAGRIALSLGFLVSIWQAMLFAGVALTTILRQLGQEEDTAHLRELVAEALDDPPLELELEVAPGSRLFVDSRGNAVDQANEVAGRSVTALQRRGETVAYIVHDPALDTDPELVQAAGQSVVLALESGRLESELRSRTAELQSSRARIVETADRDASSSRTRSPRWCSAATDGDSNQARSRPGSSDRRWAHRATAGDPGRCRGSSGRAPYSRARSLPQCPAGAWCCRRSPFPRDDRSDSDQGDRGRPRASFSVDRGSGLFLLPRGDPECDQARRAGRWVSVDLGHRDGNLAFTIADDGAGMRLRSQTDGVGLTSMRDPSARSADSSKSPPDPVKVPRYGERFQTARLFRVDRSRGRALTLEAGTETECAAGRALRPISSGGVDVRTVVREGRGVAAQRGRGAPPQRPPTRTAPSARGTGCRYRPERAQRRGRR